MEIFNINYIVSIRGDQWDGDIAFLITEMIQRNEKGHKEVLRFLSNLITWNLKTM